MAPLHAPRRHMRREEKRVNVAGRCPALGNAGLGLGRPEERGINDAGEFGGYSMPRNVFMPKA